MATRYDKHDFVYRGSINVDAIRKSDNATPSPTIFGTRACPTPGFPEVSP